MGSAGVVSFGGVRIGGVSGIFKGPSFNLTNALAGNAHLLADLGQGHWVIVNTKAGSQNLFFAFFKAP